MNTINTDLYRMISANKSIVYKSKKNSNDSDVFSSITKKNTKLTINNSLTIRDLLKDEDTSQNVIEKHMLKMNSSMFKMYNLNNSFNNFSIMDVVIKKYNSHLEIENQDSKINTKEALSSKELIEDREVIENKENIFTEIRKEQPIVKDANLISKSTNVLTDQENIDLVDQKSDVELLNDTKEFKVSLVTNLLTDINNNKKYKLPDIYITNKKNHSKFDLSI